MRQLVRKLPWKEIILAILSAVVGSAVTYAIQLGSSEKSEIAIRTAAIDTQIISEAMSAEAGKPNARVHSFSIKNTGSKNLRGFTLEFAPAGGDAAYDPLVNQLAYWSSDFDVTRTGRQGAKIERRNNSIYVTYEFFKVNEIDNLIITSDASAYDYDISSSDPDMHIKQEVVEVEFSPDFSVEALQYLGWRWLIVQSAVTGLLVALSTFSVLYFLRKRRNG